MASDLPDLGGEEARGLAAAVLLVARWRERSDRGRLAELRRLVNGRPGGEAFWQVVEAAGAGRGLEAFLRQYLPIVATTPHRRGRRAGAALRAAGVTPTRIERWLRQPTARAVEEAQGLLRRTAGADLVTLGYQLQRWSDDDRMAIARDFYRRTSVPIVAAGATTSVGEG